MLQPLQVKHPARRTNIGNSWVVEALLYKFLLVSTSTVDSGQRVTWEQGLNFSSTLICIFEQSYVSAITNNVQHESVLTNYNDHKHINKHFK